MKCVRCGHESRREELTTEACPVCGCPFVFNPNKGDPFSDQDFQAALDRVSAHGKARFTLRHLAHALSRPRPGLWEPLVYAPLAAIGGYSCWVFVQGMRRDNDGMWFASLWLMAIAVVPALFIWRSNRRRATFMRQPVVELERYRASWEAVHGKIPGLIRGEVLPAGAPPVELEEELMQCSFDRAVITDTRANAELLLANDFHFENDCAVLSLDGHPAHAFDTVRALLRNNPHLQVFALHDCTPEGCKLAWRLRRDPAWFKGIGRVFDVALRPAQAGKMKAARPQGSGSPEKHQAITAEERAFLAARSVELSAIPPEEMMKRLIRAMGAVPAAPTSGGEDQALDRAVASGWEIFVAPPAGGGDDSLG